MAFQTGMCTHPSNLFALFRTFITSHADLLDPAGNGSLPSQAWAELKHTVDGTSEEIFLRGPGNNNDQNIYVNTSFGADVAAGSDAWFFETRGATGFNPLNDVATQTGVCNNPKVMPLQDTPSQYWFFANGRRYMIFDQVTASVYTNTYAGLIRPFEPVSNIDEYPYPLYIGASMGVRGRRFSNVDGRYHRAFWNPGREADTRGTASMFSAGNVWHPISNYSDNGVKRITYSVNDLSLGNTTPFSNIYGSTSNADYFWVENVEPLIGGDYLLTDVEIQFGSNDWHSYRERYGTLDGVAHISGISQAVTNEITIGADTYIIFQEAYRTHQGAYVAIKK